jgi:protein involved in polysaccharide export with SLBB domain
MTAGSAGRIYLIPGEGRGRADMNFGTDRLEKGGALNGDADPKTANGGSLDDVMPLMLDSNQGPQGVESFFFNLPVRPGDVIMVPSNGQFIIEGWVEKPGTYPVQPGLTLRGALATAGGLSFPAKTGSVRIHRLAPTGETERHVINYSTVLAQRAPDVFIHEGDVIEVPTSLAKFVPYSVYKLTSELVRFGAGIRLVP